MEIIGINEKNMEGYKKIVFYKDLPSDIKYYDDCIREYFLLSHNETMKAINDDVIEIHTFALTALEFSYLLSKGYKIFLCENKRCGELTEGVCELTDKELHRHHDIRRIWIGGGFDNYFYPNE